eukprot:gene766-9016_t
MQLPVSNTPPNSARSVSSNGSQNNENNPILNDGEEEDFQFSIVDNLTSERKKSIIKTPDLESKKEEKKIRFDETVKINYTKTYYSRNPNSILTYRFWSHSMIVLFLFIIVPIPVFIYQLIIVITQFNVVCNQPLQILYTGDMVATFCLIIFGVVHMIYRTAESFYHKRLFNFSTPSKTVVRLSGSGPSTTVYTSSNDLKSKIRQGTPMPVKDNSNQDEIEAEERKSGELIRGILLSPRLTNVLDATKEKDNTKETEIPNETLRTENVKNEKTEEEENLTAEKKQENNAENIENAPKEDAQPEKKLKKKIPKFNIPKPDNEEELEKKKTESNNKEVETNPEKLVADGKISIEVPETPAAPDTNSFSNIHRKPSYVIAAPSNLNRGNRFGQEGFDYEKYFTLGLRLFCLLFFSLYDGWNIASAVFVFLFGDCPTKSPILFYSNVGNLVLFCSVLIIQLFFIFIVVKTVIAAKL